MYAKLLICLFLLEALHCISGANINAVQPQKRQPQTQPQRQPSNGVPQNPFLPYYQNTYLPTGNQINNYYPSSFQSALGGGGVGGIGGGYWPNQPICIPVYLPTQGSGGNGGQAYPTYPGGSFDLSLPDIGNRVGEDTGISLDIVPPSRPLTRPQPPLLHQIVPQYYPGNQGFPSFPSVPSFPSYPNQGWAPTPQSERPGATVCLNAIIRCCPRFLNDSRNRDRCLAYSGCPGPFWGTHPCSTELANELRPYFNK